MSTPRIENPLVTDPFKRRVYNVARHDVDDRPLGPGRLIAAETANEALEQWMGQRLTEDDDHDMGKDWAWLYLPGGGTLRAHQLYGRQAEAALASLRQRRAADPRYLRAIHLPLMPNPKRSPKISYSRDYTGGITVFPVEEVRRGVFKQTSEEDQYLQSDYDWSEFASILGFKPDPNAEENEIEQAGNWLDAHEGDVFDDPGYF